MMELLLLQLSNLVIPAGPIAHQAGTEALLQDKIGFIVLAVIVGPVFLLTLASIIIEFRNKSRIPELFLSAFVLLIGAMVAGFAAIGFVLKFVIPQ
ncbi:MAG: hypothetical protein A2Z28_07420 [Chloroflexi bacterium RBG_16_51_9]|nr:MAG: hypothetical protein A2Z28_07420 [Chloroflexi bacterium RBG_16_51_9]